MLVWGKEAREMEGGEGAMEAFHPQGGQKMKTDEEEQLAIKAIATLYGIEVVEMFSTIQKLAKNLGLHIASSHLFKAKPGFVLVLVLDTL